MLIIAVLFKTWVVDEEYGDKIIESTTKYQARLTNGIAWNSLGSLVGVGWAHFPLRVMNREDTPPTLYGNTGGQSPSPILREFYDKLKKFNWMSQIIYDEVEFTSAHYNIRFVLATYGYLGKSLSMEIYDWNTKQLKTSHLKISNSDLVQREASNKVYELMTWEATGLEQKYVTWEIKFDDTADQSKETVTRVMTLKNHELKFEGKFSATKAPNFLNNVVVEDKEQAGVMGSMCQCPDGTRHYAGVKKCTEGQFKDTFDCNCGIHCQNGGYLTQGCNSNEGAWSYQKLTCGAESFENTGQYVFAPITNGDALWYHLYNFRGANTIAEYTLDGKKFSQETSKDHVMMNFLSIEGSAGYKKHVAGGSFNTVVNGKKISFSSYQGPNKTDYINRGELDSLWIDGKFTYLEPFAWTFDRNDLMKEWTGETYNIEMYDMKIGKLTFTPVKENLEKTNYLVIRNEKHSIYGTYNGWFVDHDGVKYEINNANGTAIWWYAQY